MNTIARLDVGLSTVGEIIEYPEELEGGRNLLRGTSQDLKDASFSSWNDFPYEDIEGIIPNELYTAKVYLIPSKYPVTVRIFFGIGTDFPVNMESGNGEIIGPGNEGYSSITFRAPEKAEVAQFVIRHTSRDTPFHEVHYRDAKLERSPSPTPWTPAPEDLGLTYPDWVQNFTTSFSENGVIAQEFIEGDNISIGKEVTTQHIKEGGL